MCNRAVVPLPNKILRKHENMAQMIARSMIQFLSPLHSRCSIAMSMDWQVLHPPIQGITKRWENEWRKKDMLYQVPNEVELRKNANIEHGIYRMSNVEVNTEY